MNICTIDFETEGIVVGSSAPPSPVGVAIKHGDAKPFYIPFWGNPMEKFSPPKTVLFPGGNLGFVDVPFSSMTTSYSQENFQRAKHRLEGIVESGAELLFHNAKFDLRVMKHYFGIEVKDYKRIHDTMLLLFLYDPNQTRLGLKESAERLLGIKPTDKADLETYMMDNQEAMGVKISKNSNKENYFMKMLKHAPADIVGEYACNDVEITSKLFEFLWPKMFNPLCEDLTPYFQGK